MIVVLDYDHSVLLLMMLIGVEYDTGFVGGSLVLETVSRCCCHLVGVVVVLDDRCGIICIGLYGEDRRWRKEDDGGVWRC